MRRWLLILLIVVSFYLDSTLFNIVSLYGVRPDMTLALVISLGVLIGSAPAGAIGIVTGLLIDVMFNKIVGLTALTYMIAGIISGLFYRKFYADNIIIPTVIAAIAAFVKEHIFLLSVLLMGSTLSYPLILITYILPCTLITSGVCALLHLFNKRTLYRPLWRQRAIKVEKGKE